MRDDTIVYFVTTTAAIASGVFFGEWAYHLSVFGAFLFWNALNR